MALIQMASTEEAVSALIVSSVFINFYLWGIICLMSVDSGQYWVNMKVKRSPVLALKWCCNSYKEEIESVSCILSVTSLVIKQLWTVVMENRMLCLWEKSLAFYWGKLVLFYLCDYLSTQAMHNYKISETNHLRVSFSKSPISWAELWTSTFLASCQQCFIFS